MQTRLLALRSAFPQPRRCVSLQTAVYNENMPAAAPALPPAGAVTLARLGQRIRSQRQRLQVSAAIAAESAGMSRVTWHRIERGEPSVTMGAYLGAAAAVGLDFELHERAAPPDTAAAQGIRLRDFPQLRQLAWAVPGAQSMTPQQALALYERNWRHVDVARLTAEERALIESLAATFGAGRLLVPA